MLDGFYKSEFSVDERVGRSVTFMRNGKLLGGNSAFAHIGTCKESDGQIVMNIRSSRHLEDPAHQSLLGADLSHIRMVGETDGRAYRFVGSSPEMPGAVIRSLVTPLDKGEMPPAGDVGEDSIPNGLYSIHFKLLDGHAGGLTGVALINDGQLLGGDASFFYLGSYSSAGGRWKGEILSQEHTQAFQLDYPFGSRDVGIGFSGAYQGGLANFSAVAFSGKQSIRLRANLRLVERG